MTTWGHAGNDKAVTQFEAGKAVFDLAGYVSFLLWRSVYVTKQVGALLSLDIMLYSLRCEMGGDTFLHLCTKRLCD